MNRKITMTATFLLLLLVSLPAGAYGGDIDCPPHPQHCYMNPIELPDGTVLSAQAEVEAEVTATTGAQIYVQVGASAKVVVTLSINSTPTGNRTVVATVVVNETAGMQLSGSGTRTATVTPAAPAVLEFDFETDEDLPEGDVLFIPVLVRAESITTSGYAPFVVGTAGAAGGGGDGDEPDILIPIVTGLVGLATGAILTWAVLRKS